MDSYEYLKKSGSTTADGINDASDFNETKHAMKTVGISGDEQNQIFQILAAILNIGNLTFKPGPQESSQIVDKSVLNQAAKLLGVPESLMETALLSRAMASASVRGTTYSIPSNPEQALYARDALAKGIYGRLFDWLVRRTNRSMAFSGSLGAHSIGILDIYGFEIFQLNSFEQLCINYVNETLHQIFIDLTLKAEQEEYIKEGIPWQQVNYYNNKPVVDFLAGKPMGLFNILDEECLFPKGTDLSFLTKMNSNFNNSPCFKTAGSAKGQAENFTIKHYAGEVTYNVRNFLDKNRDTLFEDLKGLCLVSAVPVLKAIFEESLANEPQVQTKGGKARPVTAGFQFRQSVAELLKALYACQPHYIRTIKPNDNKAALQFDDARVTEQTRYLGLLENLHVRRAGFCYRATYDRWLKRYAVISDRTFPRFAGSAREGVEILLKEVGIPQKDYQFGKTKIFVREPQTLYNMEDGRLKAFDKIAQKVKAAKCPPKKVEGNICLEYLQLLIFEELEEFTVNRIPKRGGPITYRSYQSLEQDYIVGAVDANELKAALYQTLTDVVEPIREHFEGAGKSKGGGWFGFLKFFNKGKTQTSSLSAPR
eukprot:TRINITY_DN1051_c0_g1_i1.p1 TRINITY_DN1051_c0_g1~~TRINITY_DN1051_c0_g1_i1.p1  ORF type:complete len:596 (-),score=130.79 TRINITY_DN1051_c0_g1_i1:192-1979(-)